MVTDRSVEVLLGQTLNHSVYNSVNSVECRIYVKCFNFLPNNVMEVSRLTLSKTSSHNDINSPNVVVE
jgi:hypothetical protein